MRSNRGFLIAFSALVAAALILMTALLSVLRESGVALVRFPDGTVLLGEPEDAKRAYGDLPPVSITIVDTPRPEIPVTTAPPAEGMEPLTFNQIYKAAAPSVAAIIATSPYGTGTGSGFIMSEDGYIITNNHVVEYSEEITVMLEDGSEYPARTVGADRVSDLAVIKIGVSGLDPIEFGNSDAMEHGAPVAAIGNPLGIDLRNTITTGIISGVNRDIIIEDSAGELTMNVLQTNCAVNPGNSGGPLLNEYGQVIGIISSKIMSGAGQNVEGLGFAIPSNTAAPLVAQLIEKGFVTGRPTLGVQVDITYDESVADKYGLPPGVRIVDVSKSSDAYRKGLRPNDIVTHIDGGEVYGIADVNAIKENRAAGDVLTLTVYRAGQTLTIEVTLVEDGEIRW
ncbi:MAG: trypsin-like peptidase domain-containing protein [Oscillospiraceae bacterium]|jgi:serine protease Do|nr:trypsin-like peptidase domain-containing protein [Oscillospiraceae bacterium]